MSFGASALRTKAGTPVLLFAVFRGSYFPEAAAPDSQVNLRCAVNLSQEGGRSSFRGREHSNRRSAPLRVCDETGHARVARRPFRDESVQRFSHRAIANVRRPQSSGRTTTEDRLAYRPVRCVLRQIGWSIDAANGVKSFGPA
jgi:hypothetical protein